MSGFAWRKVAWTDPHVVWTLVLAVVAVMLVGFRVWTMNRGIYFFDETYYMFTYADPDRYAISLTGASHLIHKLFGWMHPDIVTYRYIHLWVDLLGSGVFFGGFYRWFLSVQPTQKRHVPFWTAPMLLLFCVIGNMVSGFRYPQSISYYSLTNFFLLCAASGLLAYLSFEPKPRRKALSALCLTGICTGLAMLIRFPTGVLLTAMALVIIAVQQWQYRSVGQPWLRLASQVGLYAISLLVGICLYALFIQSLQSFSLQYLPMYHMLSQGSHSLVHLLQKYGIAFLTLLNVFVEYYGWVILLWIVITRWVQKQPKLQFLHGPFYAALPVVILAVSWINQFYLPAFAHIKFFWTLIVCALVYTLPDLLRSQKNDWVLRAGLLLLFLLPWVSAFGTDISILQVMYNSILPWFALFAVLLSLISVNEKTVAKQDVRGMLTGILLLMVCCHAWYELVLNPATPSAEGLLPQTETVMQLPRLNNLLISPDSKTYFLRVKQVLNRAGFHPGDTMLALHRIPGMMYIFEGIPFGSGYYLDGAKYDHENCYYLSKTGTRTTLPKVILITTEPTLGFNHCLEEEGVFITRDYELVGVIESPVGFYSQGNKTNTELRVFKRKS